VIFLFDLLYQPFVGLLQLSLAIEPRKGQTLPRWLFPFYFVVADMVDCSKLFPVKKLLLFFALNLPIQMVFFFGV